jgi:hypothetical protein
MPRRLAAGPGGELYVVSGQGGVSFLTPRGGLLGSARIGEAALAAAVTPAGVAVSTESGRIVLLARCRWTARSRSG